MTSEVNHLSPTNYQTFLYCNWFLYTAHACGSCTGGRSAELLACLPPNAFKIGNGEMMKQLASTPWYFCSQEENFQAKVLSLCQSCLGKNLQSSEGAFPNTTSKASACMCVCVFSCKDFTGTSLCELAQMFGLSALQTPLFCTYLTRRESQPSRLP